MNKKPTCVNVVAMDKLIDYLMTCPEDWCGKCAYYVPPRKDGNYTSCNHENACKEGMLKYFAGVKEKNK